MVLRLEDGEKLAELKTTLVKKGASIGASATIICGNAIGRYAFIGAGTVVTKDIPDYVLVYGNPEDEYICEEAGEGIIFKKNKDGKVIGIEKLYVSKTLGLRQPLPVEIVVT